MGFIDREGEGKKETGRKGGREKKRKRQLFGDNQIIFNLRSETKGAWQELFRTSAHYPSLLISQKAR